MDMMNKDKRPVVDHAIDSEIKFKDMKQKLENNIHVIKILIFK